MLPYYWVLAAKHVSIYHKAIVQTLHGRHKAPVSHSVHVQRHGQMNVEHLIVVIAEVLEAWGWQLVKITRYVSRMKSST